VRFRSAKSPHQPPIGFANAAALGFLVRGPLGLRGGATQFPFSTSLEHRPKAAAADACLFEAGRITTSAPLSRAVCPASPVLLFGDADKKSPIASCHTRSPPRGGPLLPQRPGSSCAQLPLLLVVGLSRILSVFSAGLWTADTTLLHAAPRTLRTPPRWRFFVGACDNDLEIPRGNLRADRSPGPFTGSSLPRFDSPHRNSASWGPTRKCRRSWGKDAAGCPKTGT